ncbi:unnamed protein product [Adineta steineri]|uniref:Uncharacterized protein n=1 Tax=Adineta steineri TaxID=433720 RepID=A0A815LLI0_9BILA|nr:unnamed protein product [Adineta steineri]CAF1617700.1 unnamed protein product [Adineta steineri]
MIFFLLLYFFPYIHGDCLEFTNNLLINECLIKQSVNHSTNIENYYTECLQCTIQTLIKSEYIKFEENNQCLTIKLQCIQLIFNTQDIFEDFFQLHQQYIYDLFHKDDNSIKQNTLHIIIKEILFEEINIEYIERIFQFQYQAYRVLLIELYLQNSHIRIHYNLHNITRLSMKIIINCGNEITLLQTIYVIHNQKIFLESEQEFCSYISIPPTSTTISNEILSVSHDKSKDIILIIFLLTGFLLCILLTLSIYCFKRLRRYYYRLAKDNDISSESTISEDISTDSSLSLNEIPKLTPSLRGVRAIQLLDDDI